MNKKILILISIIFIFSVNNTFADSSLFEQQKKEIIAVYNSNNIKETYNMISKITAEERDAELWFLLANLSQDLDKEDDAITFLQKAISVNPEFDKAHYNLANIYLSKNKYNMAIEEYKLAIKYKKDFAFSHYNLGCTYLAQKNYNKAISSFKKAIELKKDEPSFYYNISIAYDAVDKKEKAEDAYATYMTMVKEEDL